MDATTVAVDLAKSVFEVAIANAQWRLMERRRLTRARFMRFVADTPPTHVVMEACGTAHYWGRLAQAPGHRVTLVPPAYVRPCVRRNKTDRADAEAILEAVRSGEVPAVPVKRVEQQALVAVHRVREQRMTTRTARINVLRGLLREHGILLPAGAQAALRVVPAMLEDAETSLPAHLRYVLTSVHEEVRAIEGRLANLERELRALADGDPVITRLRTSQRLKRMRYHTSRVIALERANDIVGREALSYRATRTGAAGDRRGTRLRSLGSPSRRWRSCCSC